MLTHRRTVGDSVRKTTADNRDMGTIDVFMRQIVDYAGLFPPASDFGARRKIFVELDWRKQYTPLMAVMAEHSSRFGVKLRTGGVTPDSIPPSRTVAEFLLAAAGHKLPMKATAGLHVPVPNED